MQHRFEESRVARVYLAMTAVDLGDGVKRFAAGFQVVSRVTGTAEAYAFGSVFLEDVGGWRGAIIKTCALALEVVGDVDLVILRSGHAAFSHQLRELSKKIGNVAGDRLTVRLHYDGDRPVSYVPYIAELANDAIRRRSTVVEKL